MGWIRMPQIKDIVIDWGSADVPTSLAGTDMKDLWYGEPIEIYGCYRSGGARTITLSGLAGGNPVSESYTVHLAQNNTVLDAVPKMWAREIIDYWMNEQISNNNEMNKTKILEISLAHNVLSKYTAFLAVADSIYDEKQGKWVSADEFFSNQTNNSNNNNNNNNNNTEINAGLNGIKAKPELAIQQAGRGFQFCLSGLPLDKADGFVAIYDLKGRTIMQWNIADLARGNFAWLWDLRDIYGNPLAKGCYLLSIKSRLFKIDRQLIVK